MLKYRLKRLSDVLDFKEQHLIKVIIESYFEENVDDLVFTIKALDDNYNVIEFHKICTIDELKYYINDFLNRYPNASYDIDYH